MIYNRWIFINPQVQITPAYYIADVFPITQNRICLNYIKLYLSYPFIFSKVSDICPLFLQTSGTTVIVSKCVRASVKTLGVQGSNGRPPSRRAARYSSSERGRLHLHGPAGLSVPL